MKRLLLIIPLLICNLLPAVAFGDDVNTNALLGYPYYDTNDVCAGAPSVLGASSDLPTSVPEPYNKIFSAAAKKNDVPAAIVAAIFYGGEHGNSFPDPPPPYGKGSAWESSSAGAEGPFQFLPDTWNSYKQDGNGDGTEDIQDLWDAAFGAANYLGASGAKNPATTSGLQKAIFAYNHSSSYVSSVLAAYQKFGGSTGSDSQTSLNPFVGQAYAADPATTDSTTTGGMVPSGYQLPADVMAAINKLKPVYQAAAAKADIPWTMLAAIHYREAGNDPNEDLGAGNPLGTGGGQADDQGVSQTIEESADKAAAELQDKAKNGVIHKALTATNPDPDLVKDAFFGYNGRAPVYAQQAATYGFDPATQPFEGSPYVMNKYDSKRQAMGIITHDFGGIDGTDSRPGAFTVYVLLGGADGNGGAGCTGTTGGAGVGNDGFVFPLKTTQAILKKGVDGTHWCFDSQTSCHHDNPDGSKDTAADIIAPTGTPILAAVPGTVTWIAEPNPKGGERHGGWPQLNIKGDDGNAYFYCHWGPNSLQVHVGQHVTAGEQIAEVGTSVDTGNGSVQHLHFDITPHADSRGADSDPRTDPQPLLISAFNNLPGS